MYGSNFLCFKLLYVVAFYGVQESGALVGRERPRYAETAITPTLAVEAVQLRPRTEQRLSSLACNL
jgi:hypothetical protein